jgi:hypothetical protein
MFWSLYKRLFLYFFRPSPFFTGGAGVAGTGAAVTGIGGPTTAGARSTVLAGGLSAGFSALNAVAVSESSATARIVDFICVSLGYSSFANFAK